MPVYAYKGIGPNGKTVEGVRDADSPKAVRQLMRKEGVVVVDVDEKKGKGSALGKGKGLQREVNFGQMLGGIKKSEVAGFTRQLATLLKAGIPLAEALTALFEQSESVKFKSVLSDVKTAVNEGTHLADALSKHPKVFDELMVSMIRAGETAGNLDDVLARLADFMESAAKLKAKVQGAMVYPVIMLVVGVVIMVVLMVAVVPKITEIFVSQDMPMPLNTRILIAMANFFSDYWVVMTAIVIAGSVGFRVWTRSPSGRPIWHRLLLRLPLFGPLLRKFSISRFARTVGTMLRSGVPMLKTLDISKDVLGNVILVRVVEDARTAVQEGESLAIALRRSGHFPATVTHMIAVGERSGALEDMLLRVADAHDQELDMSLGRLTTMLEPLMLVVMGGAVAFVVFSILMPLMDMQNIASF